MATMGRSILDPRFQYVSAVKTDVAATWRRFGFDVRRNIERRADWAQALTVPESDVANIVSDNHGRDRVSETSLAIDR